MVRGQRSEIRNQNQKSDTQIKIKTRRPNKLEENLLGQFKILNQKSAFRTEAKRGSPKVNRRSEVRGQMKSEIRNRKSFTQIEIITRRPNKLEENLLGQSEILNSKSAPDCYRNRNPKSAIRNYSAKACLKVTSFPASSSHKRRLRVLKLLRKVTGSTF